MQDLSLDTRKPHKGWVWAGEIVQHTLLAEDQSSVPNAHVDNLQWLVPPALRRCDAGSFCGILHSCAYTHTLTSPINKKKNKHVFKG